MCQGTVYLIVRHMHISAGIRIDEDTCAAGYEMTPLERFEVLYMPVMILRP